MNFLDLNTLEAGVLKRYSKHLKFHLYPKNKYIYMKKEKDQNLWLVYFSFF